MNDERQKPGHAPPSSPRGPDPRLLGLLAIVAVIALAILLAHVMSSLNHADLCLASGGRGC